MCLAVVALSAHPRYRLVIAANRDEYHARPATPAAWWSDLELLGGRDLEAGGTWLAITRQGRWAFVTNVREPRPNDPAARSRGALVPEVLQATGEIPLALAQILGDDANYNGFNLLAGTERDGYWVSNRSAGVPPTEDSHTLQDRVHRLSGGVHGISNAALDTPWPKLTRVKSGVAAWVAKGSADTEALFTLLTDRTCASDDELPATGIPLVRERQLSSPFIVSADYGTRCSTIVTVSHQRHACLVERTFDPAARAIGEVRHEFDLESAT